MEKNYYCNGHWFKTYDRASFYADIVLELTNKYHVVYTRAEMDSVVNGMVDSIINHEMECGK
jgi:hypothetical protein